MLVPIHLGYHWCLAVVDLRDKSISYYDSNGSRNYCCLNVLKQYLVEENLEKKKSFLDLSTWVLANITDIPQQTNGNDCGVFVCIFAEYLSANKIFNFCQKDMQYFRKKLMYEMLT